MGGGGERRAGDVSFKTLESKTRTHLTATSQTQLGVDLHRLLHSRTGNERGDWRKVSAHGNRSKETRLVVGGVVCVVLSLREPGKKLRFLLSVESFFLGCFSKFCSSQGQIAEVPEYYVPQLFAVFQKSRGVCVMGVGTSQAQAVCPKKC